MMSRLSHPFQQSHSKQSSSPQQQPSPPLVPKKSVLRQQLRYGGKAQAIVVNEHQHPYQHSSQQQQQQQPPLPLLRGGGGGGGGGAPYQQQQQQQQQQGDWDYTSNNFSEYRNNIHHGVVPPTMLYHHPHQQQQLLPPQYQQYATHTTTITHPHPSEQEGHRDSVSSTVPMIGVTSTSAGINHHNISNTIQFSNHHHTVDVPKIELSARQQQMMRQRQHRQQQPPPPPQEAPIPPTPFQTRSNVTVANAKYIIATSSPPPPPPPAAAAALPYYEPWDKPFVVQQQPRAATAATTPVVGANEARIATQKLPRPKTLLQSVLQHPAQRHSPSPKTAVVRQQQRQQLLRSSPDSSRRRGGRDPPATSNTITTNTTATTNIGNPSTLAEPMEAQREFVRSLLLQRHSSSSSKMTKPFSSSSAVGSTTGSQSSVGGGAARSHTSNGGGRRVLQKKTSTAVSTSPPATTKNKSRFQQILEKAASKALSPRQTVSLSSSPQQQKPRQKTVEENNAATAFTAVVERKHPVPKAAATVSSSSSLQEQMRLRFQKKHHVVEPPPPERPPPPTTVKPESDATNTPGPFTTTTTTLTEGYESFVHSLMNELSSDHSELYSSFVMAFDATLGRDDVVPLCPHHQTNNNKNKKVDETMLKQLHVHLKEWNGGTNYLPKSQLIRDKVYHKNQQRKQKKSPSTTTTKQQQQLPVVELPPVVPQVPTQTVESPTTIASKLEPSRRPEEYDEVMNSRSTDSNTNTNERDDTVVDTKKKSSSKISLSVEIPASHSTDSHSTTTANTNDTSPTTSSTTIAEMTTRSSTTSSQRSYRRPTTAAKGAFNDNVQKIATTISSLTNTEPISLEWNTIQLRTVNSNDSSNGASLIKGKNDVHNTAPEWANMALRPVSCRSTASSSSATTTASTISKTLSPHNNNDVAYVGNKIESYEKLTMDEIMETEHVTMIRLKDEIINCCGGDETDDTNRYGTGIESRVVIGETLIRHIQYDAVDLTAPVTVLWTLPREDMEPDGVTINMSTFKVTLLLSLQLYHHHQHPSQLQRRKVLSFETSEDCLRFATAFYSKPTVVSQQQQQQQQLAPLPLPGLDPDEHLQEREHDRPIVAEKAALTSTDIIHVTEQPLNQEEQVVLEKYRELRLTKEATDALLETMALQQTKYNNGTEKIMSCTLPSNVDAVIGSLPSSPISTFTATTAGAGGDNKTAISSSLSDFQWTGDEKKTIETYKLLIQRGVPVDAVRFKMTMEQVDAKIVTYILSNDESSFSSSGDVKGADKKGESLLSLAENVIAEKYRKMLKLRIPIDAVRHKMEQDQVESNIVAVVLGDDHQPKQTKSGASTKTIGSTKTTLSEEEESVAVQYRKLLKINVSKDALLSRMQREGVSPNIIVAILGQNALPPTDDGSKTVGGTSGTGSKMISINWDHTENALAGSVWEEWQNAEPEPMDFTQLKQMFQRKERLQKDMKKMDPTNGVGKAKLLDITRSNNIAISLKAFKEFAQSELSDIIRFLDPIRKIRGERTNFIRDLLPTPLEVKVIDEYTGSDDRLVPAELWFRHLRGIQRIERKARVIRTMEMFIADTVEIRDNFCLLAEVCRQVVVSPKLKDVLGLALRVGNAMNEGTRNGRAAGFKFNSLLRFTQTKSADGKITVLDYLVSVFVEKGETDTLDLVSDFPDCHKASRFLISDMSNEVKSLKESLEQCKLELADLEREQNPKQEQQIEKNGSTASNPRALLFTSILSRGDDNDDSLPITRKCSESFTKRDEFLAAVKGSKKGDANVMNNGGTDNETRNRELTCTTYKNSVSGGILRLRSFIEVVEETFARLEKTRNDALAACKDLSVYCGESGGIGVTISLLDILSQFTKSVEDALKKYHEQQINDARKLKVQETKETQSVKSSKSGDSTPKKDDTSFVVLVNDILKNANPEFIDDFKRGRVLPNPSKSLKAVYERERKGSTIGNLRLDIVSAIQQRGENVNDEEIEKARSAFAGVQALPDDSSPRELMIDQISSFPFSSSDSQSECTMSIDPGNHSESADADADNVLPNTNRASARIPSVENLRLITSKENGDEENKMNDISFDIRSSQDRLRSRRSLSPSNINSGSLADVMKSLDEIKKQSPMYPSPPKRMQSQRLPNVIPPLSQHPRSVERKTIAERARDKRSEKRPNHPNVSVPVTATTTTTASVPVSSSFTLRAPSSLSLTSNQQQQQRRLTSVNETTGCGTTEDDFHRHDFDNSILEEKGVSEQQQQQPCVPIKDSSFARLARQKRLQKRTTK